MKNRKYLVILIVVAAVAAAIITALNHRLDPEKLEASDIKLQVSEYMPDNEHFFISGGKTLQWLEFYNYGESDIKMSELKLYCGKEKINLPERTIEAGEYCVCFTSNHKGDDLLPLTLSEDGGDRIVIIDGEKKLVDFVETKAAKADCSLIRAGTNGDSEWKESKNPTPGFSNSKEGLKDFRASRRIKNESGIVINEIMTSNEDAFIDSEGFTPDYVEILNFSDSDADISGFGLSDNENDVFKFSFPDGTELKAGECCLILFSKDYEEARETDEGQYRANFGLKNGEDSVILSNAEAYITDEKRDLDIDKDASLSRLEDGVFVQTYNISPGFINSVDGIAAFNKSVEKAVNDGVYISEACTKNTKYVPVNGKYYDWIELKNSGEKPVDLEGYSLSDDRKDPGKFVFPAVNLEKGEYITVFAADSSVDGKISTGFNLNGRCSVYLFDKNQDIADSISLNDLPLNVSKGRQDNSDGWKYFETPTPGEKNGTGKPIVCEPPTASKVSAKYDGVSSLTVELKGRGEIYYTTDGSSPTLSSSRYSGSLTFSKTTVLRAVCVDEDSVMSAPATFTYLINEDQDMDVVSLASDPAGLFSSASGIYAAGPGASAEFPHLGANYWKDWKREADISLISDKEKGFSERCEVSIFGGFSRGYDKKSLKVKFKDIYGAGKLEYDLFENRSFDEYDALVLRAGGQDAYKAMMRDDLTTYLADPILDVMATRPVALYINGEYWGIYFLREKINKEFAASHYNVSPESIDMLQGNSIVNAGSKEPWDELIKFVRSHDLSVAENYEFVSERVDLQNYADYIIAELYCGNTDAGNIRCFKSREGDNKWRWILYDTDMGFQPGLSDSVFSYLNPKGNGANNGFTTALINGLLKNKEFRSLFVERLKYQMHNIWNTDRVLDAIDLFSSSISSNVSRNKARWNVSRDWEALVEQLRIFARGRQEILKKEFATDARVRAIIALSENELKEIFG